MRWGLPTCPERTRHRPHTCPNLCSYLPLRRAPTEISNNAIVTSLYDLEHPEDGKLTRCESIVQKARDRSGSKRIGVVLTIAARVRGVGMSQARACSRDAARSSAGAHAVAHARSSWAHLQAH